jgi:hypothetical protein
MEESLNKDGDSGKEQKPVPTVSAVFDDGSILELVYRPQEKRTAFVLWKDGEWNLESSINVNPLCPGMSGSHGSRVWRLSLPMRWCLAHLRGNSLLEFIKRSNERSPGGRNSWPGK